MKQATAEAQTVENMTTAPQAHVVLTGDNADDLATAAEHLKSFGLTVGFVDDLFGAVKADALRDPEPDVFIVRHAFSNDALTECLNTASSDDRRPRIRIVVQTRLGSAADRRRLMLSGANYLVLMPVEPHVLHRLLRAALRDLAAAETIQGFVSSNKSGIGRISLGVFEIKTFEEAEKLSSMLAFNYPSPEPVSVGIWELLRNAIEHGNLEIDFEEKSMLLEQGRFDQEIRRRLSLPCFRDRVARVHFKAGRREIRLRVIDDGSGFDFARFLGAEPPVNTPNGRGIFIAERMSFDTVRFHGKGNIAEAVVKLKDAGS